MRKNMYIVVIMFLLPMMSGCMTNGDFNFIEKSIRHQIYPAKLKTNFKFSFGFTSLTSARLITSFIDDAEEATMYLREVKKVQVGVYEINKAKDVSRFQIPREAEKRLLRKGWTPFVRVRERGGGQVDLFYKQISNHTASIYAVVLEHDELVIVEIKGRLEKILEKAIQEHGISVTDHI